MSLFFHPQILLKSHKWKKRELPTDKSHRPDKLYTTLSPTQEWIVTELRKTLLLPLDDLLAITREFVIPDVSRSKGNKGTLPFLRYFAYTL